MLEAENIVFHINLGRPYRFMTWIEDLIFWSNFTQSTYYCMYLRKLTYHILAIVLSNLFAHSFYSAVES